jgi:hypothetical protein
VVAAEVGRPRGADAAHSRDRAEYLAAFTRDALRAADSGSFDDEGAWEDHVACYSPWCFDLADLQAPVSIWHGIQDFLPSPMPDGWLTVSRT